MAKTYRKRNQSASDYFQKQTTLSHFQLAQVIQDGKSAIDDLQIELGRRLVESILLMDREQVGGPAYKPKPGYKKWSSQKRSVFVGKGKISVDVPRLRNEEGEVTLPSYDKLRKPDAFSTELLETCMAGLSGRRYGEVIANAGEQFGVSKSSVSRRIKAASIQQLRELTERKLDFFEAFAIFLDAVHKSGKIVMAAIGIDLGGKKQALGLWEGATENAEVCEAMFSDLENRGLSLHPNILFVTDGASGISKALNARFGKDLLHQRCTIHKKRNVLRHLPKRHHAEFRRRYDIAINMVEYDAARKELASVLKWLKGINTSAANSLAEGGEKLLTVHRLVFPEKLRKSFLTTNIIESSFNGLSYAEKNVKRYQKGDMLMRWISAVLLYRENNYRRVKGYAEIENVVKRLVAKTYSLEKEIRVA